MVSKVVLGEQLSGYNFAIKFFSVYKIFSILKFIYVSILIVKLNKRNRSVLITSDANSFFYPWKILLEADSCNKASKGEKKFGLN